MARIGTPTQRKASQIAMGVIRGSGRRWPAMVWMAVRAMGFLKRVHQLGAESAKN